MTGGQWGPLDDPCVVVADDDQASRVSLLDLVHRLGVRAVEAATGEEVMEAVRQERPALVVLDVELEGMSGYEVCRELRETYGETLMIMFVSASRVRTSDEVAGLLLGADEYLAKPIHSDRFLARARRLLARATAGQAPSGDAVRLTPREREVLSLLVAGKRTSEIAVQIHISPKTVATHLEHIMRKLGTHSQAQTVALAVRERIVNLPPRAA